MLMPLSYHVLVWATFLRFRYANLAYGLLSALLMSHSFVVFPYPSSASVVPFPFSTTPDCNAYVHMPYHRAHLRPR